MPIVSVHSFRRGTGKSHLTANLAALLAVEGRRVGVMDTNLQSSSLHILFGLDGATPTLNDYVWGWCEIHEAAHDVTQNLRSDLAGRVYLVSGSTELPDIARSLREDFDLNRLNEGFLQLVKRLRLDALFIDTPAGLNEVTLAAFALSQALVVILRPDQQDYQGTSVIVEVARKLRGPRLALVVNEVPHSFDLVEVCEQVERAYRCPVAAVLPHSDGLMALASGGFFALRHPEHPITADLKRVAAMLVGLSG